MVKYEYWFMRADMAELVTTGSNLRETINKMGSEGWELFNITPVQIAHQYEHPEGFYDRSVYEERASNDFVISCLASFRRGIS